LHPSTHDYPTLPSTHHHRCSFFQSGPDTTIDLTPGQQTLRLQGTSLLFSSSCSFTGLVIELQYPLGFSGPRGNTMYRLVSGSFARFAYFFTTLEGHSPGISVADGAATVFRSFLVQYDEEPPTFSNCPSNITVFADQSSNATRNLTWTAPTASDNLFVQHVTSTLQPPATVGITGIASPVIVRYRAWDSSSNMVCVCVCVMVCV
jgi:hypothetical protein